MQERERERERGRQRKRETKGGTHTHTERETETDRQTDREGERARGKERKAHHVLTRRGHQPRQQQQWHTRASVHKPLSEHDSRKSPAGHTKAQHAAITTRYCAASTRFGGFRKRFEQVPHTRVTNALPPTCMLYRCCNGVNCGWMTTQEPRKSFSRLQLCIPRRRTQYGALVTGNTTSNMH